MPDLFPTITPSDWPKHLQLGRQRRAGAVGRINLAITQYNMNTKYVTHVHRVVDQKAYGEQGNPFRHPVVGGLKLVAMARGDFCNVVSDIEEVLENDDLRDADKLSQIQTIMDQRWDTPVAEATP